jgi:ubiquitin C-terminal hydrolase
MLELDIHKESKDESMPMPMSIADLLLRHFSVEKIDDWSCDTCKSSGAKQNVPFLFPSVLMISIQRFRMTSSGSLVKVHRPLHINPELVIEKPGSMHVKYGLTALGNHFGRYEFGHYNAYCLVEKTSNTWACFDDLDKHILPNTDFLQNNRDAYIVCYQQCVTINNDPGP